MESQETYTQALERSLGRDHPIHTLVAEHDIILAALDDLEASNIFLQKRETVNLNHDAEAKGWITRLKRAATILAEAESHHRREEEALFPEIEARGLVPPCRAMVAEHGVLRPRKKELRQLVEDAADLEQVGLADPETMASFKGQLQELTDIIVPGLRNHIAKENQVLYPAALQVITDKATWRSIKAKGDEIGYCQWPGSSQGDEKVGDIVARIPLAGEVFRRHGIDYCCGGHRPLSVAIKDDGANEGAVLAELQALHDISGITETTGDRQGRVDDEARQWLQAPLDELLDHIVTKHHAYLEQALPELSRLTTMTLRAHGTSHPELARVHRLFHTLKRELEQHLITEEEVLFPLIREYVATRDVDQIASAIDVVERLEQEHDKAGAALKELRAISGDYRLPDAACSTYEETYQRLQELEKDVFEHVHLENNLLHPRLREVVG